MNKPVKQTSRPNRGGWQKGEKSCEWLDRRRHLDNQVVMGQIGPGRAVEVLGGRGNGVENDRKLWATREADAEEVEE